MKKYFAKYLPVEGEIKEGDMFFDSRLGVCRRSFEATKINSVWVCWKGGITNLNFTEEHKKAELFLCSRDQTFNIGDKVYDHDLSIMIVKENADCHNIYCESEELEGEECAKSLNCVVEDCDDPTKSPFEGLTKIIGPISKEAIWVREGDQFDEDDFSVVGWFEEGFGKPEDLDHLIVGSFESIQIKYPNWKTETIKIKCNQCLTYH